MQIKETLVYADPGVPKCPDLQQVTKESSVKMESHATPVEGTPEQRYATLHRAIEQGLDSDDVWCELASVSAALGHSGEAKMCAERIRDDVRRDKYERTLALGGKLAEGQSPSMAPAASNAGPTKKRRSDAKDDPGVVDHLLDAGQYMMHQQMPWLVLTTTLAFPVIVGLGGFLTAGGSPLLLAALAAVPGMCVLLVVAAMAHEILRSSSNGESDVPMLPEFSRLLYGARKFLWDVVLVLALFFSLPVVFAIRGAPLTTTLPAMAIGVYFAPLAFALRHVRGDLRSLSPIFLLRAARRCGRGYSLIAISIVLAIAPAAAVAAFVVGHAVWVQIAVIGPLCVLPMLGVSRLLGTWLDSHRESLGTILNLQPAPSKPQRVRARAGKQSDPLREDGLPDAPHPARRSPSKRVRATERTGPTPGPIQAASVPSSCLAGQPTPRAIEGRRPAVKPPLASSHSTQGTEKEVLSGIDEFVGAYVVTGEERRLRGAASRPR